MFHCLLTFTADILVVYALWIFCFVPSHCVISEKVVLQNSKFYLEGGKKRLLPISSQIEIFVDEGLLKCPISNTLTLTLKSLSHVQFCATPWTIAYLAPPSMEFSRQESWSWFLFPSAGDLPNPGIEPGSPAS